MSACQRRGWNPRNMELWGAGIVYKEAEASAGTNLRHDGMSRDGRRGAPGRLLADDRGDRQQTTTAMALSPSLPSAFQLASDEVHSWCCGYRQRRSALSNAPVSCPTTIVVPTVPIKPRVEARLMDLRAARSLPVNTGRMNRGQSQWSRLRWRSLRCSTWLNCLRRRIRRIPVPLHRPSCPPPGNSPSAQHWRRVRLPSLRK